MYTRIRNGIIYKCQIFTVNSFTNNCSTHIEDLDVLIDNIFDIARVIYNM